MEDHAVGIGLRLAVDLQVVPEELVQRLVGHIAMNTAAIGDGAAHKTPFKGGYRRLEASLVAEPDAIPGRMPFISTPV